MQRKDLVIVLGDVIIASEVKTIEIKRFSSYGDNSIETPSLDVQRLVTQVFL